MTTVTPRIRDLLDDPFALYPGRNVRNYAESGGAIDFYGPFRDGEPIEFDDSFTDGLTSRTSLDDEEQVDYLGAGGHLALLGASVVGSDFDRIIAENPNQGYGESLYQAAGETWDRGVEGVKGLFSGSETPMPTPTYVPPPNYVAGAYTPSSALPPQLSLPGHFPAPRLSGYPAGPRAGGPPGGPSLAHARANAPTPVSPWKSSLPSTALYAGVNLGSRLLSGQPIGDAAKDVALETGFRWAGNALGSYVGMPWLGDAGVAIAGLFGGVPDIVDDVIDFFGDLF